MNDSYTKRVSDEFGLKIPQGYVKFMNSYPAELESTKLVLSWCQEPISERYFRKDRDAVLELNRRVRTPNVPWLEDGSPWPNHFFVIGDDHCGNYYAIDTNEDSAIVYFYDHEIAKFSMEALSLDAFKVQRIQDTLDLNADHDKNA